jgi:hypothetical protein
MIPKFRIMERQTEHPQRRRIRRAGLAAVILGAFALAPATSVATAAEGKAPVIVSVEWSAGGEITVGGEINPEGLATTYEVALLCRTCGPTDYVPAVGQLPGVDERRAVSLDLTGIKPGSYGFYVHAGNADGETTREGVLMVPPLPPGAYPEGKPGEQYEAPPISKASLESAEHQAALDTAEAEAERRQTKEQEEQKASEAAVGQVAEVQALQRTLQEDQAAAVRRREEEEHAACIVPSLRGDTLSFARRALTEAHCRPGRIILSRRRHGTLRVARQGAQPGERLAHEARIALWVAASSGGERASRRGRAR